MLRRLLRLVAQQISGGEYVLGVQFHFGRFEETNADAADTLWIPFAAQLTDTMVM